jgi:hypothetical protein
MIRINPCTTSLRQIGRVLTLPVVEASCRGTGKGLPAFCRADVLTDVVSVNKSETGFGLKVRSAGSWKGFFSMAYQVLSIDKLHGQVVQDRIS